MNLKSRRTTIKIVITIAIIVGGLYGIVALQGSGGTPRVTVLPETHDWGTIGTSLATAEFTVRNDGDGDLIVKKIATSCGCTTAKLSTEQGTTKLMGMDHGNIPPIRAKVKPGEEATLTVIFDPQFHGDLHGPVTRSVYLTTNDPDNREVDVKLTANVL